MHLAFAKSNRLCAAKTGSLDFMQLKLVSDFFTAHLHPFVFHSLDETGVKEKLRITDLSWMKPLSTDVLQLH